MSHNVKALIPPVTRNLTLSCGLRMMVAMVITSASSVSKSHMLGERPKLTASMARITKELSRENLAHALRWITNVTSATHAKLAQLLALWPKEYLCQVLPLRYTWKNNIRISAPNMATLKIQRAIAKYQVTSALVASTLTQPPLNVLLACLVLNGVRSLLSHLAFSSAISDGTTLKPYLFCSPYLIHLALRLGAAPAMRK